MTTRASSISEVKLIYGATVVIYDRNRFIIQAAGVSVEELFKIADPTEKYQVVLINILPNLSVEHLIA